MNRIFFVLFLIAAVVGTMVLPVPTTAQTMSTISKGFPLNSAQTPITGFAAAATPTQTITSPAACKMGTLPAGTVAVTVIASGAVNYGDSTVTSGGPSTGVHTWGTIADTAKETFYIYPGTTNPNIYFRPVATGTTCYIRLLPHVQR